MAASFISQSTVNYASRTDTTITAPVDIQDGDWLAIVFIIFNNAPQVPPYTPPTDFNSLGAPFPLAVISDDLVVDLFVKEAAAEAGDYTITHISSFTTAYMLVVRGSTGPADFSTIISDVSNTFDIPTVTSINDDSLVLLWGQSSNFGGAVTPPGSPPVFDERFDSGLSLLYAATGIMSPPGATGDKTITLSEAPASGGMVVFEAEAAPPVVGGRERVIRLHNNDGRWI